MTKQALSRQLSAEEGMFLNLSQLSRKLNISRDTLRTWLRDTESIQNGRSKMYFVDDVVQAVLARRN